MVIVVVVRVEVEVIVVVICSGCSSSSGYSSCRISNNWRNIK